EEQTEMFPKAERTISDDELANLGALMDARKRELLSGGTSIGGSLMKMVKGAIDAITGNGEERSAESAQEKKPKRSAARRPSSRSSAGLVTRATKATKSVAAATTKQVKVVASGVTKTAERIKEAAVGKSAPRRKKASTAKR